MRTALMYIADPAPISCAVDAKAFLQKIIKVRYHLIRSNTGNTDPSMVHEFHHLKSWMEFYNPTNAQCVNYIKKFPTRIKTIIPGKGSACHEAFIADLQSILNLP